MSSRFLDTLRKRVLFFDGGMGTQIQARELVPEDCGGRRWEGCNDDLSLTRPAVVEAVHGAYFEAGADVGETGGFHASPVPHERGVLAGREGRRRGGRVGPIQWSVTVHPRGRMLRGADIAGALATLEAMGADVIGLNCSTGPDLMRDAIRYLSQNANTPIHCIPNA